MKKRVALVSVLQLYFSNVAYAQMPAVEQFRSSMVFLTPLATTSGGAEISLRSGTGFIISADGYVLTTFHLVKPPEKSVQYDKVEVRGAVGSRYEARYPLEVVRQDRDSDLLLLKLPWLGRPWIPLKFCRDTELQIDNSLMSLGFPLVSDLIQQEGKLKSLQGPQGLWQSSLPLNPGDSGGPILNSSGFVVGIAKAGLEYSEDANKSYLASGISYLIPVQYASVILQSAAVKDTCKLPSSGSVSNATPLIDTVRFSIDQTKDDHSGLSPSSRPYSFTFYAPTGKRFTSASFDGSKNNVSGPNFVISQDGKRLVVNFTLTSGPVFDQWRGWLSGAVIANTE